MNILMIGELYRFGGASEMMENLAKGLEDDGYAVTRLYGYNYAKYSTDERHFVLFENILLRRLHNRLRYWLEKYNLGNLYVSCYIHHLIRKNKIDLVHFHAMQGGFISLRDIKRICKKIDVVWTIHDTWPFTGGCMYYWDCLAWQNAACKNCTEVDLEMSYKNTTVNWKRKKKALQKKGIYYVAPSKWMFENLGKSFLGGEKLTLIENGINLDVFKPLENIDALKRKYKVELSKKILMFSAGSVKNRYKGWNYLRDALTQLERKEEFALLIVGKEADNIEYLGISMIKAGFIQEKQILNELYNIADIFVLPSVQDNFPTVTLEAQAAGTPVLAFAVGGIEEQITTETGWTVREISADSLKSEIELIFKENNWAETVRAKGQMARKRSEELYGEKRMTERYEKIYAEAKSHT